MYAKRLSDGMEGEKKEGGRVERKKGK